MSNTEYKNFTVARDERGVMRVALDVPGRPLNVFDEDVLTELASIVDGLENSDDVHVVVFTSGKDSGFLAGADVSRIAEIDTDAAAREVAALGQDLFDRVERLPMPTVAVIHGPCLGGGLEFAMSCSHRVARNDESTKLGLPETQLGILPAWGGTQRLPRWIGVSAALDVILAGKTLSAKRAAKLGLVDLAVDADEMDANVDRVVNELLDGGRASRTDRAATRSYAPSAKRSLASRLVDGTRPGRWFVYRTAGKRIARQTTNYPAVGAALEAVRVGMEESFEAGIQAERDAIAELLFTPTCRNLLELFFRRERARNVKTWTSATTRPTDEITRVAVVGGGVMGAGIAQLAAYQGFDVVLKDVDDAAVGAGMQRIHGLFDKAVSAGKLSRNEANARAAAVTPTTEAEPLSGSQLAVEAVVEREDVKRAVFAELESHLSRHAVLATNTSSLSVTRLAEGMHHPERVAGLHYFNPVHRMELVEVVRGEQTSDEAIAVLVRHVRKLGKTPIVVKDSPGFLVNRVLFPYLDEAVRMVCEGEGVETIDRAAKRFGMPMGPLELLDTVGLDVAAHVSESFDAVTLETGPTAERLREMVEAGRLGRKSGSGFYHWKNGKRDAPVDQTDSDSGKSAATHDAGGFGVPPLARRLVFAMINEAARCMDEGVVPEAWMVDLAMVLGTGFAPFRGGPLSLVETWGADRVVEELEDLKGRHGKRFTPSTWLSGNAAKDSGTEKNRELEAAAV